MSLACLPPELFPTILDHLDPDVLQSSILALTRALPYADIPLRRFFERIKLRSADRVIQLQRRLRGGRVEVQYVRELHIETWTADPQVIINLLALLENLTCLGLSVGSNFSPEHLLEVFERPRERLQSLSLRFRPYVERANYYQFLKGAYFDPTISAIASWPSSSLRSLSIVQDPFVRQGTFAQPLVFFTFQPFLSLSISAAGKSITTLRVRIPARDVAPYLAVSPQAFPLLHTLDLSTGNVKGAQLNRLLGRFDRLQHMRLDSCFLLAGREAEEWAALGKDCALTGARRARDRERALKAWQERQIENNNQIAIGRENNLMAVMYRSRARAGRKGLATATISIRGGGEPSLPTPPLSTAASSTTSTSTSTVPPSILTKKIRIAPLPPSLQTLTATAPAALPGIDPSSHFSALQAEFAKGWDAGIAQLRASWTRLRTSARNGLVRAFVLGPGAAPEAVSLDGLEELDEEAWDALVDAEYPVPVLCLAGENEGDECRYGELHAEACGHCMTETAWDVGSK